ncbi:CopM family metallochaperone [Methylobacterium sp. Leaf399]|uniref:CopM family metallochaperone n=1 Tax=Methylobacterium sp. Leaf399 TaxID=1736364 RepID=UPI003FCDBEA0
MTRLAVPLIVAGMSLGGIALGYGAALSQAEPAHRHTAQPPDSGFDALMARSMERMHADMAVPPSGDPDRDFAAMMIPHHQGAIDMAKAQLIHGRDPVLLRLAQGIIVEQGQEIEVMRRALADRVPAAGTLPSAPVPHPHHHGAAPMPAQGTIR